MEHRPLTHLLVALESPSWETRDRALAALHHRWTDDPTAWRQVSIALQSHDPDTRRRAAELCALHPDAVSPDPLLPRLRDPSVHVRSAAAHALAARRTPTPAIVIALLALAADPEPRAHIAALAALCVLAPSPAAVQRLGRILVTDRYSLAAAALRTLALAPPSLCGCIAPLLDARDPLDRRAALTVLHAARIAADPLLEGIIRLTPPGTDTYVRRAAVRTLGRATHPTRELVTLLRDLTRDWDPVLRMGAVAALGQLASRSDGAHGRFVQAMRRAAPDESHDLAAALRAAGRPAPPHGPLLERLATCTGYARLDLADAILAPLRGRTVLPGVVRDGIALPIPDGRADDAIDELADNRRCTVAASLLERSTDPSAAVRACCVIFAAHLDRGIATAIALQRMAERDPEPAVRALGAALLEEFAAA